MIAAVGLAVGALFGAPHTPAPHAWTLAHARSVLVAGEFGVTDATQADRPDYDLTFTTQAAAALRPVGRGKGGRWLRFAFAGPAHDELTDADLAVNFVLTTAGRLTGFRGPPADLTQPAFPIRAAFYYAWYPEAWTRDAIYPYTHYHPSLDYYSADDASVMRDQIDALRYAHLNAAVYSWFGTSGPPDTGDRFWRYLTASRSTPLRWAIYYEREGHGDPSVAEIRSDLEWIRDFYAPAPAYLKVGGRFVVFVYGDPQDSCGMAERWHEANTTIGAYLVLKAFAGYRDCAAQPDAWHEYSGALAEYDLPPSAFMISPGFDETRAPSAALSRSIGQWRQSVADMVASGASWQLVISFNEWAEGTSVESAREWATASGYGAYLDALHAEVP